MPEIDINEYPEQEPEELRIEKWTLFGTLWNWVGVTINKTNVLKGWTKRERSDGEMIALIHSELSECLEAMRRGNPPSKKIPEFSWAEEELADTVIRIIDLCIKNDYDLPKAMCAKMEYNKTRPYMHGGKKF